MNKKFKYTSVVAAGLVTLGLVGGTLAYFTSTDSVTNSFETGKTNDDYESGVKVDEIFEPGVGETATNVLPGVAVDKDVRVQNTASYDQFIRVKFTPQFEDTSLDNSKITLQFKTENLSTEVTEGKWYKQGEYYYYIGKVASEDYTEYLLDSVTLAIDAGEAYKNQAYDVIVDAESVQAAANAFAEWGIVDDTENNNDLYSVLESLQ